MIAINKNVALAYLKYVKDKGLSKLELVEDALDKLNKHVLVPSEAFTAIFHEVSKDDKEGNEKFVECLGKYETPWNPDGGVASLPKLPYSTLASYVNIIFEDLGGKEQVMKDLYTLFVKGEIGARDLQYVTESFNMKMDEKFLEDTVKSWRYCKMINELLVFKD